MESDVEEQNTGLAIIYDEIACLLTATLDVDDFVDLEALRRKTADPKLYRRDLEVAHPTPSGDSRARRASVGATKATKGLFGRKKKHAMAITSAEAAYSEAHAAWERKWRQLEFDIRKMLTGMLTLSATGSQGLRKNELESTPRL